MNTLERVGSNYKAWLGEPREIFQPQEKYSELSKHFSVLVYERGDHLLLCSFGASETSIPGSSKAFNLPGGSSHEYLLHARQQDLEEMRDLLHKVACYPYISNRFVYSGMAIPIGDDIAGKPTLNHVYITYPYQDDPNIYTESPSGEIPLGDRLIFVFWIIPVFQQEIELLKRVGAEEFDRLLGESEIKAFDLDRKPIVVT